MTTTMNHKGKVEKNKLIFFDKGLWSKHLKTLEGKHVTITIRKSTKPRNLPQNARHWARMTLAASILDDRTPEELHYDFCSALIEPDRTTTPPRYRTSSELTTLEFSRWEEDIDRILAGLGILLPEPEDNREGQTPSR